VVCLLPPDRSWSSFTDPGGMKGCVGLVGWFHTEIVYPLEDGHHTVEMTLAKTLLDTVSHFPSHDIVPSPRPSV